MPDEQLLNRFSTGFSTQGSTAANLFYDLFDIRVGVFLGAYVFLNLVIGGKDGGMVSSAEE